MALAMGFPSLGKRFGFPPSVDLGDIHGARLNGRRPPQAPEKKIPLRSFPHCMFEFGALSFLLARTQAFEHLLNNIVWVYEH